MSTDHEFVVVGAVEGEITGDGSGVALPEPDWDELERRGDRDMTVVAWPLALWALALVAVVVWVRR